MPQEILHVKSESSNDVSILTSLPTFDDLRWEIRNEAARYRADNLMDVERVFEFIKSHILDLHVRQSVSELVLTDSRSDYKKYADRRASSELGLWCLEHKAIAIEESPSRMYHGGTDRDYTLWAWISKLRPRFRNL